MRVVAEKHTRSLQPNAASTVGMIHEDKFTAVGVGVFERRELSRLRPEGLVGCDCGGFQEKEEK
jgi:hypothetical protein